MATYTPAGTVSVTNSGGIIITSGATGLQSGSNAWFRGDGGAGATASFSGTSHTQSAATVVLPPTIMLGKILRVI
jgi:hypothetical protein